ncbi:MAG TPA: hypothetical protein VFH76_07460 [Kribbella sp.]|nr:hypothetical protein [Kribbella sp.]
MTDVEIDPQSWEYRLVAAVVLAVDQRFGGTAAAPRTSWTGLLLEEPDPDLLGTAGDDGSMSVSVANVLAPLREARDLDRPLTGGEALELRDSIGTLAHEAAHLVTKAGDHTAPDAYPYDSAAEADNEGRTESWTHDNLDQIIGDVFPDAGLAHVTADVLSQESIDAYPAYTAAARDLDRGVAARSGLTHQQVTQKLMLTDDADRWNVMADLVIDERLAKPGLMPESDRADVRRRLIAPLRDALSGLEAVQDDELLDSSRQSDLSAEAAQKAIAGLDRELHRIERSYRIDVAQRARLQAHGDLSPDLRRLQALTDPQAPAGRASDQTLPAQGSRSRPRGRQIDRPAGSGWWGGW